MAAASNEVSSARQSLAAKNTSGLIENTFKVVKKSNEMTMLTQEAFKQNVEIAGSVDALVNGIAMASFMGRLFTGD